MHSLTDLRGALSLQALVLGLSRACALLGMGVIRARMRKQVRVRLRRETLDAGKGGTIWLSPASRVCVRVESTDLCSLGVQLVENTAEMGTSCFERGELTSTRLRCIGGRVGRLGVDEEESSEGRKEGGRRGRREGGSRGREKEEPIAGELNGGIANTRRSADCHCRHGLSHEIVTRPEEVVLQRA